MVIKRMAEEGEQKLNELSSQAIPIGTPVKAIM